MSEGPSIEELRRKYLGVEAEQKKPLTVEDVLAMLKKDHENYACQDNITAAQVASVLKRIIEKIEG